MFLYLKICYFVMFQFHNNKVIKSVRELYPLFEKYTLHHKSITVKLPSSGSLSLRGRLIMTRYVITKNPQVKIISEKLRTLISPA